MSQQQANNYVGRFAPSPTGQLHFGSLLAALASHLDARAIGGRWLIRIEDLDPPREVAGSADSIVSDLMSWNMHSDAAILYQSQRQAAYQAACDVLVEKNLAYWCGCSRRDLPASGIYPGTCRDGLPRGKKPRALRIRTPDHPIEFNDRIQGPVACQLAQQCGDFVILRADGYFAYQLAVVVDDDFQEITHIVRGADLLDSTPRQVWLQQCLDIPTPVYAHIPVVTQPDGQKLSKRLGSDPLRTAEPLPSFRLALKFLGHEPPQLDWKGTWDWALKHWSASLVPRLREQSVQDIQ